MNRNRRKEIKSAIEQLQKLCSTIENLRDEEQDYFDTMPENFQYGERGEAAEEAITNLEDALSIIEDAIGSLELAAE